MTPRENMERGKQLCRQGLYKEALMHFRSAASEYEKVGQRGDSITARCFATQCLAAIDRIDDAESEILPCARAASDFEEELSPLTRCNAFMTLGVVLRVRGEYASAREWLQRAAVLGSRQLESVDPRTCCNGFTSLGDLLREEGRLAQAEKWLRKAAILSDSPRQPLSPQTRCRTFTAFGDLLGDRGRYSESEHWLRKAANLSDDPQQPIDPITRCSAFNALASLLLMQGAYSPAESWLRKAAQLAAAGRHPLDGQTRCNVFVSLGQALFSQGKYPEAEKWLRRAARLAIGRRHLLNSLSRCNAFENLGQLLYRQDRYGAAKRWLYKAAQLAEDARQPLDPQTRCEVFASLAAVLLALEEYAEAAKWLQNATSLIDASRRQLSPLTHHNVLISFGEVLRAQNRYAEAERLFRRAARLADRPKNPLSPTARLNAAGNLARVFAARSAWRKSLPHIRRARELLQDVLSEHRWPQGMKNTLANFVWILHLGRDVAHHLWVESETEEYLWEILFFSDQHKCVAIREALRRGPDARHTNEPPARTWRPGPSDWRRQFGEYEPKKSPLHQRAALRRIVRRNQPSTEEDLFELPGSKMDAGKNAVGKPISREELSTLLSGPNHALLVYTFSDNDLMVLPVVSGDGTPRILHGPGGFVVVENARIQIEKIRVKLRERLKKLFSKVKEGQEPWHKRPAQELSRNRYFDWRSNIGVPLYTLLGFDQLFSRLGYAEEMHWTIIPDGALFELPLHAAYSPERSQYLYEQVASLNYGLSLRTLWLQHQLETDAAQADAKTATLEGTVFANPDRNGHPILNTIREVAYLVDAFGWQNWRVLGEKSPEQANRSNMNHCHSVGNLLWCIGHGGAFQNSYTTPDGRNVKSTRPSLLLCDGALSDAWMAQNHYDFRRIWLLHFSACLLGELKEDDDSKQIEGFIATLALLGARRVTSAMWPLVDNAAAEFAKHWIAALKQHVFCTNRKNRAFSCALKEAIGTFRATQGGRFDYEAFWAPYIMYGAG